MRLPAHVPDAGLGLQRRIHGALDGFDRSARVDLLEELLDDRLVRLDVTEEAVLRIFVINANADPQPEALILDVDVPE